MCIRDRTNAIRTGAKTGAITPVFCGAATAQEAVDLAMWGLQKLIDVYKRQVSFIAAHF